MSDMPTIGPVPPAIRSLAERIERALRDPVGAIPSIGEDEPADQILADRAAIEAETERLYHQQWTAKHTAERKARLSWLCSVLTEALGGEGRGGEQEGTGE